MIEELKSAAIVLSEYVLENVNISAKVKTLESLKRAADVLNASIYSRVRIQDGIALETYFSIVANFEKVRLYLTYARPSEPCDANIPGWDVGEERVSTREEVRAAIGAPAKEMSSTSSIRNIEPNDVMRWTL